MERPYEVVVTALEPHEIPARDPIKVLPGDEVVVGERDMVWPEFVLVRTKNGEGWVPARHLSSDRGPATVVEEYDTTELPTRQGEQLAVLRRDDISEWLWCRNERGQEGWVPSRKVS